MNAKTPAAALRYANLLEPVSEDQPCGPDLEYDPTFVMLQAAAALKTDAQYGNFVDAPPPINWAEVERDCRALLLRTKDLRLLAILARCHVRQSGAAGLRDSLSLLKDMLERYGEALHPSPHSEGERDPVMFANAIASLADATAMLMDVRDITLPKAAGLQLQLRDIEKSFTVPRQKDALAPESTTRMLRELWIRHDKTVTALAEAQHALADIISWASRILGADAPNLDALSKVLQPFMQASLDITGSPAASPRTSESTAPPESDAMHPSAAIADEAVASVDLPSTSDTAPVRMDRWTALATLQDVRAWFEQNEPSSPVIVLLRQSERMVGKRFSELAHIIPADLLAKWDAVNA